MQQIRNAEQNKKTPDFGSLFICNNYMVQYFQLFLHEIRDEIAKWRIILAVPYQEHLMSK